MRGYQAIFVPLAALSSPGYSPMGGQPAVYLYITALEANCRFCRCAINAAVNSVVGGSTVAGSEDHL